MASKSSPQEICVDIVKFEVSSDNSDEHEPVILPAPSSVYSPLNTTPTVTNQITANHHNTTSSNNSAPFSFSICTTPINATSTPSTNTIDSSNKTVTPSSELIRSFGHNSSTPVNINGNPVLQAGSLASQLCPLGPKERCTPSQAQAMGEQLLSLMAAHENSSTPLPFELQNTFDIFHRCLAVAYGTFFLNLYTKSNAPCLLCHGCKSLYPPGQYIHHSCLALPPNIVPCRSRMWRRCLVPLMSQDMDKADQKERWKFVLEKFSHASMAVGKRNIAFLTVEPQLLEMPECKKGKFIEKSSKAKPSKKGGKGAEEGINDTPPTNLMLLGKAVENSTNTTNNGAVSLSLEEDDNNTIVYTCISDDEPTTSESSFSNLHKSCSVGETPNNGVMCIVKDLVRELDKLLKELSNTKEKLMQTEARLKVVTSGDSLSEQFVQSLLAQEKLTAEKKDLASRLQLEVEKSSTLEKQLNRIQVLNMEIQNQFKL